MSARRSAGQRPARPAPVCETCGADLWWAWSLHGKCWIGLAPERRPLASTTGTYEIWPDAHGGLLARYLPPGERGEMDRSFRGLHHNAACGTWAKDATSSLVREARAAVPVLPPGDLLVLSRRLHEIQELISAEITSHAVSDR